LNSGRHFDDETVVQVLRDVVLRLVPQVEHSVIEGAGHMMPLSHAAELTRTLVPAVASASRWSGAQR
jgi:hypothetical protein